MTDQLESDLRSLLTRRAAAVTPDEPGGEQAIARRLAAGDTAVAEEISLDPPRRLSWLAAAVVLVVAAIGAAAVVDRDDDPTVRTGPSSPPAPSGPVAVLQFRTVQATGPCAEMGTSALPVRPDDDTLCYAFGDTLLGNPLIERAGVFASFSGTGSPIQGGGEGTSAVPEEPLGVTDESFGVTLTLTPDGIEAFNVLAGQCFDREPTCGTGQLAIVVDGDVLSAPTIQQPAFEADEIQISGDFTQAEAEALAASLQPTELDVARRLAQDRARQQALERRAREADERSGDDPTVGAPGDSAKDVAERAALALFGEEYVTASTFEAGATTGVTMEGPRGEIVADVVYDGGAGAPRVLLIRPSSGPDHVLSIPPGGPPAIDVPEAGDVTYEVFDEGFEKLAGGTSTANQGDPVELDLRGLSAAPLWIVVQLETPDGRVLAWFETMGD